MGSALNQRTTDRSFWNVVLSESKLHNKNDELKTVLNAANVLIKASAGNDMGFEVMNKRTNYKAVLTRPSQGTECSRKPDCEYRFKCKEEGCTHKYKHRSSRSRHARHAHKSNATSNFDNLHRPQ